MKLILLAFAALCLLILAMWYFVRDFGHYLYKTTERLFKPSRNAPVFYMSELMTTLFSCYIIAAAGLVFMQSATAIIAWFFSGNLIDYFTILRSVFSFTNKMGMPLELKYLVPGLLVTPVIQLAGVYMIFKGIRVLFVWTNKKYKGYYRGESECFYFGFVATLGLLLFDMVLYTQDNSTINKVANLMFLCIGKLAYPFFYLSLSHINLLRIDYYRNSLPQYIKMSTNEKQVTFSSWKLLFFTYLVSVLLQLPSHLGLQFLRSDWLVIILAIIVCGVCYFLLQYVLKRGWNLLGTVLYDRSFRIEITDNLYEPSQSVKKYVMIFVLICLGIFAFKHFDLFTMAIAIAVMPILLSVIVLIIVYLTGYLFFNIRYLLKERKFHLFQWKTIYVYFKNVSFGISKAIAPISILVSAVFVFLSFFPKRLEYHNPHISRSLVDNNKEVLFIERTHGNVCIPICYTDIPPFIEKTIIAQEDKDFKNQGKFLPRFNNWHGISLKFFLPNRGGSNINMQLIKNIALNGTHAQDVARKISEAVSSYMLSITHEPKEIVTMYVNSVSFSGGGGHIGLGAAALQVFGRPVNQLNHIEQFYLVRTLPRGKGIVTKNGIVDYKEVINYPEEIKGALINRATVLCNDGVISRKELNMMIMDSLRFKSNQNYQSGIATSSRLFLEEHLASEKGKYVSTVTKQNQDKLIVAWEAYTNNRLFPPALEKEGCKLYATVLVINYKTAEVLGHFCNHTDDLSDFGMGFPMASLVKPFIIIQLHEEGIPIELWDGQVQGKRVAQNANKLFSNLYVGTTTILSKSLNAPFSNINNPLPIYRAVEDKFSLMHIPPQRELCDDTYNYPLGSRLITIWNIAQSYQCLMNDGEFKPLTVVTGKFDTQMRKVSDISRAKEIQLYQTHNTNIIKDALAQTLIDGTAASLKPILPNKQLFIKTGSSNEMTGPNHGYTILADDKYLIVSWVSYGKIAGERLELNDTPPIPYGSGARSAGVLAAYVYNQLFFLK